MTDTPTSEELDHMFDEGVDMTPYMDMDSFEFHPAEANEPVTMRLNIDPVKVVALDRRARRRGQTRSEYVSSLIDAALAT